MAAAMRRSPRLNSGLRRAVHWAIATVSDCGRVAAQNSRGVAESTELLLYRGHRPSRTSPRPGALPPLHRMCSADEPEGKIKPITRRAQAADPARCDIAEG
jgi:hypothetical protein